jgi:hypothetical protein
MLRASDQGENLFHFNQRWNWRKMEMNNIHKNFFKVVLLAALLSAVTGCAKQCDIAAAVQATLTAESAINAMVDARVQATLTAESAINATANARNQASQTAMQTPVPPLETVIQPTMTPTQVIVETVNATQTATSSPEPPVNPADPVTISSPADGSTASQYNEVSGFVDKTALGGKFLNIIVTTRTGEFWVQKEPTIQENGDWSSLVILGTQTLGLDEKFIICAVIADQQLSEGEIYSYPAGPQACITVTRKD